MRPVNSRRRNKRNVHIPEIMLTPLIDTALTLLVIFMVTTPVIQNSIKVDLPHGQAREDKGLPQEIVVYINKQGQLFFDGAPTNQQKLIEQVQKSVGTKKNAMVFVKGDRAVSYGTVLELVDTIKVVAGVECVALATQQPPYQNKKKT